MIQRAPTKAWAAGAAALAASLLWFGLTATAGAQGQAIEIHKSKSAEFHGFTDPILIGIVGTDDRPGVSGARADAMHVVGINPELLQATIINIPRDTYVDIPGHGRRKINEAHTLGQAELVGATLENLIGAPVPFIITTNFEGFTNLVDEAGGVAIDVPYGITDSFSSANVGPGPNHMSGAAALAYARARHGTPRGDFSRSSNQGLLMTSALRQLQANPPSPAAMMKNVAILFRHIKTSSGVTPADLYQLADLAMSIPADAVLSITMPGTTGSAGGASVVFPTEAATPLFQDLVDDGVVQAPPAQDGAGNTFP